MHKALINRLFPETIDLAAQEVPGDHREEKYHSSNQWGR